MSSSDFLKQWLKRQTSKRKLDLFVVACHNELKFTDEGTIKATNMLEQYADNLITKDYIQEIVSVSPILSNIISRTAYNRVESTTYIATYRLTSGEYSANKYWKEYEKIRKKQMKIAEDIFHSYNQPIPINPIIQTIANSIYWNKQWEDITILADALEDIKASDEIINHLRSGQPHYRGCWVLDLILNKV